MFFWICRILLWLPCKIFFPTRVYGKKNLRKTKSVIVSSHQSNMDSILILTNTNFKFYTLTKKELFKSKLGNWIFTHLHAIPVDRQSNDLSAVKSSLKVLNQDKPLLVFPSGTREDENHNTENFKNGTAMIAFKTKSDIIPVVFSRKPKLFRLTKIFIGNSIKYDDYSLLGEDNKEKYSLITDKIQNEMNLLKTNGKKQILITKEKICS